MAYIDLERTRCCVGSSLELKLVEIVQLDILHDEQPHPALCLLRKRFGRARAASELEKVHPKALLVYLVAFGVPRSLFVESVSSSVRF